MDLIQLVRAKKFTVLLGKNGAGKSTHLRRLDAQGVFQSKYVTPERGGVLKYEANVEQNMVNNPDWLKGSRRVNRTENFRQQSATLFRNLETMFYRALEDDEEKRRDMTYKFKVILDQINEHLPAVKMIRSDRGFAIKSKADEEIGEQNLSSGESEFIALAIEVLVFARSEGASKYLFLDEPDVHLHPDLQSKLIQFVEKVATEFDLSVVVATHSTAIVSAFSDNADLQIVPVTSRDQTDFDAVTRSKVLEELLPIFGPHPLSSLFAKSPICLVEGEDDKRILEQAVRSAQGRVRLNPCVVGSVDQMGAWEAWLDKFLPVLYDQPIAYSLRDLDDGENCDINDLIHVRRSRLNCYSMENLLLTEESFAAAGVSEAEFLRGVRAWADSAIEKERARVGLARELIENFGRRRKMKLKDLRNVIVTSLGVSKPWEVHVGQLLAGAEWPARNDGAEHSLLSYVGEKAKSHIFAAV